MATVNVTVPVYTKFGDEETQIGEITVPMEVQMVVEKGSNIVTFNISPSDLFREVLGRFFEQPQKPVEFPDTTTP